MTRKQKETRHGRAELRLAERAAQWNAKRENRYLPKWWEHVNIRLYTKSNVWTEPQRKMMRKASRFHMVRFAGLAVLITLLSYVAYETHGYVRAQSMVLSLVNAQEEAVPSLLDQLRPYRRWATPRLQSVIDDEPLTTDERRQQLHARLALLADDQSHLSMLLQEMLRAEVSYLGLIRDTLRPYQSRFVEDLWKILRDGTQPAELRFWAGMALADYAPSSDQWSDIDWRFLVEQLVTANPEHQPRLRDYLRPLDEQLLPDLEHLFSDSQLPDSQQLSVAIAIADFAADDIPRLARLLTVATPGQYAILFPLVAAAPDASAQELLRRLVAEQPARDLDPGQRVDLGKRRAGAAITLLRLGLRDEIFDVLRIPHDPERRVRDDPESLTQFVHRCRERQVTPGELLKCLKRADDARQSKTGLDRQLEDRVLFGLLLALGDFELNTLPENGRTTLIQQLADWCASDPSSAIHGATG